MSADDQAVLLRVLRGSPTPEELAAATAALLGLARATTTATAVPATTAATTTASDDSPESPVGASPGVRRRARWHRTAHSAHRGAGSWRR
ncbi:acyl-CoA carboxylase subunit epsilon [Streptomyces sp. NBC_01136]|uniref:acyl-CoA carboxylase subunit epsilon n=1 Tax=unclassified Streptomyces TaxID=2593676 RepID=UPI00324C9016|nr:acyl-CoA carboxylase subunit epsilon [Streptomyces sp. NBC_01136]